MDSSERKDMNGGDVNNASKQMIFGVSFSPFLFEEDRAHVITKRTERLVTAMCMVVDCLPEEDALRQKIKMNALDLLESSYLLLGEVSTKRYSIETEMSQKLLLLRSLIALSFTLGSMSDMNSKILIDEVSSVLDHLSQSRGYNAESGFARGHSQVGDVTLSPDMFKEETPVAPRVSTPRTLHFGSQKDMSFTKDQVIHKAHVPFAPAPSSPEYKGHHKVSAPNRVLLNQQKVVPSASAQAKSDLALRIARRNTILRLIKDKREVTIKDISMVVSEISEKTIQRELLTLVSEGVLKKTGEKRWSRYSILSNQEAK